MKQNKNIDTSAGFYTDNYPILSLSDTDTFENHADNLGDLLKNCVRFQYASEIKRKNILYKLEVTSDLTEYIKIIVGMIYPNLYIKHISIGGSYLFKMDEINDIDFNIIVTGSHFSYTDVFEVDKINKKLSFNVKKISLMIFGEDDFLFKTDVNDLIETPDYIHTSLCMREGLVFNMRNIPIYGYLCQPRGLDRQNLLVRIRRQLFHARLMIEGKVDLHRNSDARLLKSVGRMAEAFLYLSVGFPHLKMSPKDILEKEKILSKSLYRADIISWLQEADNCVKFLSNI